MKTAIVFLLGLGLVACQPSKLKLGEEVGPEGSASTEPVRMLSSLKEFKLGDKINVAVGDSLLLREGEFVWDHSFSDGTTYCEQETNFAGTMASFTCPSSGTLVIKLSFFPEGDLEKEETYEKVIEISDSGIIVQPPTSDPGVKPDPKAPMDPIVIGKALYETRCLGCHGATGKRNKTANQIASAISGVSAMRSLTDLSRADLTAIEAYLAR